PPTAPALFGPGDGGTVGKRPCQRPAPRGRRLPHAGGQTRGEDSFLNCATATGPDPGSLLQQLESHLPEKLLIDLEALLLRSMDESLWLGVQAEAETVFRIALYFLPFLTPVSLPTGLPVLRIRPCLLVSASN